MVRHIVAWSHQDGFSDAEKSDHLKKIKEGLESLKGVIEGIAELNVHIDILPSGNRSAVLNGLFENREALEVYQIHPEHKKMSCYVRSVMTDRVCIDYIEN